jgi:hypothetical protein
VVQTTQPDCAVDFPMYGMLETCCHFTPYRGLLFQRCKLLVSALPVLSNGGGIIGAVADIGGDQTPDYVTYATKIVTQINNYTLYRIPLFCLSREYHTRHNEC